MNCEHVNLELEEVVIDIHVSVKTVLQPIDNIAEKWLIDFSIKKSTWESEINGFMLPPLSLSLFLYSKLLSNGHYLNEERNNNKNYSLLGVVFSVDQLTESSS